jgi:DNA repair exonuclease SbcCD ATPase subunit
MSEFETCPCCGKPLEPHERDDVRRRYELLIAMYKEGRRDAERPEIKEEKWRLWMKPSWFRD